MKMQDWIKALDNQIVAHQRKILEGEKISHEQAMQKAKTSYSRVSVVVGVGLAFAGQVIVGK